MEDCFEEQLLLLAYAAEITRAVADKLEDIRQSPLTQNPVMIETTPVHVVKTGRFPIAAGGMTPQLLILYVLDHTRLLIHLMHIVEALAVDFETPPITPTDEGPASPSSAPPLREYRDRAAPEPIERMLRRILAQSTRTRGH